jgi:hypothetical protein
MGGRRVETDRAVLFFCSGDETPRKHDFVLSCFRGFPSDASLFLAERPVPQALERPAVD